MWLVDDDVMGVHGVRATPHWRVTVTAVRGVLAAAVLVVLYYVLPLDLKFDTSGVGDSWSVSWCSSAS